MDKEEFIFEKFARLPHFKAESFERRQPPEPDILLTFNGGKKVAFELVEIVDEDLMEPIGSKPDEAFVGMIEDRLEEMLEKKFKKSKGYQTPYDVHLLAYYNGIPSLYEHPKDMQIIEGRIASKLGFYKFKRRLDFLCSRKKTIEYKDSITGLNKMNGNEQEKPEWQPRWESFVWRPGDFVIRDAAGKEVCVEELKKKQRQKECEAEPLIKK